MGNESAEFQRGYNEAMSVFEAGFHPGYCQNSEQAVRVTRNMWKAGLSGKEAQSQRSAFITADRERNRKVSGAVQGGLSGGNGSFVKPSNHSEAESLEAIYERRKREMSQPSTNVEPDTSQDNLDEQAK